MHYVLDFILFIFFKANLPLLLFIRCHTFKSKSIDLRNLKTSQTITPFF